MLFGAKHSANERMGSKKSMSSKKKELILFRAKHCARKSRAPKIRVPKKKELILSFFEPHIVQKKNIRAKKKYEFRKKKGTHTFTGLTLHQKIMGSKK